MIRNKKGFSLLEVLIALVVMSGSIMVVAMAWSGSQLRMKKMKLNNQAAFLLDYKMAEVNRRFKNEITLLPEEEQGTFEDLGVEYKNFTWTLKSKKFDMPDVTPLLMQNQKAPDAMLLMMMDQLSEFFHQAAKEVTITVVFTFGKSSVKYPASMFLIDFNQQLPLPNLGGGAGGGGLGGGGTNP